MSFHARLEPGCLCQGSMALDKEKMLVQNRVLPFFKILKPMYGRQKSNSIHTELMSLLLVKLYLVTLFQLKHPILLGISVFHTLSMPLNLLASFTLIPQLSSYEPPLEDKTCKKDWAHYRPTETTLQTRKRETLLSSGSCELLGNPASEAGTPGCKVVGVAIRAHPITRLEIWRLPPAATLQYSNIEITFGWPLLCWLLTQGCPGKWRGLHKAERPESEASRGTLRWS